MHYIHKEILSLPGMDPVSQKRKFFGQDMIFFILFAALPSSFFALVPQTVFYKPGAYDLNFLFFISGLVYFFIFFKHLPKIWKMPSGKFFLILCVYLLFQIFYSFFYQEIPIREIITVFRKNFFWPLPTLGFLLYIASMSSYRIERFMRWLMLVTFAMGLLYIFSNLTGIDVWGAHVKDAPIFEGVVLMQNTFAIPKYLHILFVFALISSLVDPKFKNYWMWVTALLVTILSFVRNQMAVYVLYMLTAYLLTKVGKITTNISKTLKQLTLLFIAAILLVTVFPKHLDRLLYKFGFYDTQLGKIAYTVDRVKTGTYDFRTKLIENAYERTKDNTVFGNGYIREATPGDYDFVLGSDTMIPPVLFTEGILGMILRWLPLLALLQLGIKYLIKQDNAFKLFWLAIVTLIAPQFINIVQTTIFTEYNRWYFIFAILLLFKYRMEKEKTKGIKHELS